MVAIYITLTMLGIFALLGAMVAMILGLYEKITERKAFKWGWILALISFLLNFIKMIVEVNGLNIAITLLSLGLFIAYLTLFLQGEESKRQG